jgi:hypothetical protein
MLMSVACDRRASQLGDDHCATSSPRQPLPNFTLLCSNLALCSPPSTQPTTNHAPHIIHNPLTGSHPAYGTQWHGTRSKHATSPMATLLTTTGTLHVATTPTTPCAAGPAASSQIHVMRTACAITSATRWAQGATTTLGLTGGNPVSIAAG